jgi:hypothetical protein
VIRPQGLDDNRDDIHTAHHELMVILHDAIHVTGLSVK